MTCGRRADEGDARAGRTARRTRPSPRRTPSRATPRPPGRRAARAPARRSRGRGSRRRRRRRSAGPISTASSASRTNVACRSAAVYTAMTRSAGRPSAFHSRTALISRMAGSPRLTIATRWKAKSGRLIALLTEGGADVVGGAPGRGAPAVPIGVLEDVQHHLVRDDAPGRCASPRTRRPRRPRTRARTPAPVP